MIIVGIDANKNQPIAFGEWDFLPLLDHHSVAQLISGII
jgi:hypothetical protein